MRGRGKNTGWEWREGGTWTFNREWRGRGTSGGENKLPRRKPFERKTWWKIGISLRMWRWEWGFFPCASTQREMITEGNDVSIYILTLRVTFGGKCGKWSQGKDGGACVHLVLWAVMWDAFYFSYLLYGTFERSWNMYLRFRPTALNTIFCGYLPKLIC